MRFGISVPPFADFSDPRALAELAQDAEAAGWDGFFIWDAVFFDPTFHPAADPWVSLAAVALSTQRLRIGTMVTPLARRRPWKLARETVSVDRLSNGRLTLGENIADLAGLQAAYDAYHASLGGREAPVIDGLTGDQRFFLAYAQTWATKMRDEALRQRIATDGHAPGMYRALTVRNLDPWYQAFDVQEGQRLYLAPDQRVRVW